MGCISNVKFLSNDTKLSQSNFTFDQCVCFHWFHNYSGFNYFTQNQTCELFENFTTDFELVVNTQTQFCFNNQPIRPTLIVPTSSITTKAVSLASAITTAIPLDSTTDSPITSTLRLSTAHTTVLSDVTTALNELKWNSSGITVASGNGNSSILSPYAVAVDDQYYIYIAERDNNRISKWSPNPNGLAAAAVSHTATGELIQSPSLYVNTKTGDIYVANERNLSVIFFANGSLTTSSIPRTSSGASPGVNAIYLDPNGTIFITDTAQNRIYNWITNETVAGGQGPGPGANQLNQPKRFFIDSNYSFYIADANNGRVQKWLRGAMSGETVAGGYGIGSNANQLYAPLGVVVDSQGNVLVCDSGNNRVQRWSRGATTGQTIAGNPNGTAGSGPNELNSPKGIALDKNDNLYVADYNNYRIQIFKIL